MAGDDGGFSFEPEKRGHFRCGRIVNQTQVL
jgi:hypothetical protein